MAGGRDRIQNDDLNKNTWLEVRVYSYEVCLSVYRLRVHDIPGAWVPYIWYNTYGKSSYAGGTARPQNDYFNRKAWFKGPARKSF